jgi:hypothetical protein
VSAKVQTFGRDRRRQNVFVPHSPLAITTGPSRNDMKLTWSWPPRTARAWKRLFAIDSLPRGNESSVGGGFWSGIAVGSVNDCDGDGVRDIVVASTNTTGLGNPGLVHLCSGKSKKCWRGVTRSLVDSTK